MMTRRAGLALLATVSHGTAGVRAAEATPDTAAISRRSRGDIPPAPPARPVWRRDRTGQHRTRRARAPAAFLVSDMRVRLAQQLGPRGGRLKLHVRRHHAIPGPCGGRTAVRPSRRGDICEIGRRFPRMAAYDDLRGCDTAPYLGAELYPGHGDIDYSVTVPADFIVAGAGALHNPDQVLSRTQRDRLARAAGSDGTVMIRTPQEAASEVDEILPLLRDPAAPVITEAATLRVGYADGSSRRIRVAAETWMQRPQATVGVAGPARISSVTIDPQCRLPDIDPSNNGVRAAAPVRSKAGP